MTYESALDIPIAATFFQNYAASTKQEAPFSLRQLAERIRTTSAAAKADLPWLKLATFGERKTENNSFRHDANVLAVNGIEADYDSERMTIDDAVALLRTYRIAAMVYTSPSHTDAKPRWRVLCPLSAPVAPDQRAKLLGRLNGLLGGIFSGESFTLSQAYYFGSVDRNPAHRVELIDGTPIDECDALDSVWTGRPHSGSSGSAGGPSSALDESGLLDEIISATSYHESTVRLLGKWAQEGVSELNAYLKVVAAFDEIPESARDGRWRERRADVARCTRDIYAKHAASPSRRLPVGDSRDDFADGIVAPEPVPPHGKLRFLTPEDCKKTVVPDYLIKGVAARNHVGCIFGAAGAGKSVLAPYVGYLVAQGRPVFGCRTRKGGVLYAAAEDDSGMQLRVEGMLQVHGPAPGFIVVAGVSDLTDEDQVAELAGYIQEHKPALVIVDTVRLAFPIGDENTSEVMGQIIKTARGIATHGCGVLLVHHTPKAAGSETPSGHGSFNAALDWSIHVVQADQDKIVRGQMRKNRSGALDNIRVAYVIDKLILEDRVDSDGEAVDVPTLREVREVSAPVKLSKAVVAIRDRLAAVLTAGGVSSIGLEDFQRACLADHSISASDVPENRRKVFLRSYKEALVAKALRNEGEQIFLTVSNGTNRTAFGNSSGQTTDFPIELAETDDIPN